MTSKRAITVLLLLFAVGSAAYVVLGGPPRNVPMETGAGSSIPTPGSPSDTPGVSPKAVPELIVYYMDMGKDCTTCLNLETYTFEAVETWFADELATGRISWRTVDLDEPANEHFVDEFGLYTKSVVLVRPIDGAPYQFDSLSRIWELVYDKEAYMTYIREQIQVFLALPGAPG